MLLTQKLEAGEVELRPVEIPLAKILEPALEAARNLAAQKKVAFRATYDAGLTVKLDPALTRSAVQNLADNAAKYTDTGEIEMTVEQDRDDDGGDDGERLIIHFRDSCAGLSAEELQTIFEPFRRGHTGKAGTGLGLAIAQRAVAAQGGSIHAESSGKAGCHFWLELPRSARTPASSKDADDSSTSDRRRKP